MSSWPSHDRLINEECPEPQENGDATRLRLGSRELDEGSRAEALNAANTTEQLVFRVRITDS